MSDGRVCIFDKNPADFEQAYCMNVDCGKEPASPGVPDSKPGNSNCKEVVDQETEEVWSNLTAAEIPDTADAEMNNILLMEIHQKVEKLFYLGFSNGGVLTDPGLTSILKVLNKNLTIFDNNSDYKLFLLHYGSMCGRGVDIVGPAFDPDENYNIEYIVAVQRAFESNCLFSGINTNKIKDLWLVSNYESDRLFIDATTNGHIYSLGDSLGSKPKYFAKDFLDLLDRVYQICLYQYDNSSESESC